MDVPVRGDRGDLGDLGSGGDGFCIGGEEVDGSFGATAEVHWVASRCDVLDAPGINGAGEDSGSRQPSRLSSVRHPGRGWSAMSRC